MTLTLYLTIVVLITLNEFDPSIAAGPLMEFLNAFFKSFIYNIITTKKEGDLCKKSVQASRQQCTVNKISFKKRQNNYRLKGP